MGDQGLRDEPLPLFAVAAAREAVVVPEQLKPTMSLRPMPAGKEVVEDLPAPETLHGNGQSALGPDL